MWAKFGALNREIEDIFDVTVEIIKKHKIFKKIYLILVILLYNIM